MFCLINQITPAQKRPMHFAKNYYDTFVIFYKGDNMDYLEKLIQLREEKGLTQNDLTEIYGCNQSNISKIERKERKLDIEQLIALCRFYNVSADYILGLSDFTDIRK